jgi:hypothetical protein
MLLWLLSGSGPQCRSEHPTDWPFSRTNPYPEENTIPGSDGAFGGRASEKPPALAVGSRHACKINKQVILSDSSKSRTVGSDKITYT